MSPRAKGEHALKRDEWSPKWGHVDAVLDDDHPADEHYMGSEKWRCYECHEKIEIVESSMQLVRQP